MPFGKSRQRNVPKYTTHTQGGCFAHKTLLVCGVLVAIVVVAVVAKIPYNFAGGGRGAGGGGGLSTKFEFEFQVLFNKEWQ